MGRRAFGFTSVGVSTSAGRMGQRNTRLESKPKPESNPDYQTYGREGDVDYAVDHNFDLYQPSDYDEMYDTARDESNKSKSDEAEEGQGFASICLNATTSQKRWSFVAVLCIIFVALGLVAIGVGVGKTSDQTMSDSIEEVLVRKQVGNPAEYFNKNFADYEAGFSSRGELWLGLRKLHQLTSIGDYSLNITLADFDGKSYNAYYDQFQVGPGDGYVLSVSGFDADRSTLGDSFYYGNENKFSAKDKDQSPSKQNCAFHLKGGGWFGYCHLCHLTGLHTTSSQHNPAPGYTSGTQIWWLNGGERVTGNSYNSWKEAKMVMIKK